MLSGAGLQLEVRGANRRRHRDASLQLRTDQIDVLDLDGSHALPTGDILKDLLRLESHEPHGPRLP